MSSSGMLRRVALVRTDVSEELSASFIRVSQEPHGVTSQKTPFYLGLLLTVHRYIVLYLRPADAFPNTFRDGESKPNKLNGF
jgi:hypothetical protein